MNAVIKSSRRAGTAGVAAALALCAMGFAGAVQARDNVYWSVGVGSPGVGLNVGNAFPVYTQPQAVYVQSAPIYVQPQPVFVQQQPNYYYGQPQVIYVQPGYRRGWHGKHGRDHDRDDDDHDGREYRQGYRQGYAPIYYRR